MKVDRSKTFRCPLSCPSPDRDSNAALNLRDWQSEDIRPELVEDSKRTSSETVLAASAASNSAERRIGTVYLLMTGCQSWQIRLDFLKR